jgi:hypothetical protein
VLGVVYREGSPLHPFRRFSVVKSFLNEMALAFQPLENNFELGWVIEGDKGFQETLALTNQSPIVPSINHLFTFGS